jgi:hypothetical protein
VPKKAKKEGVLQTAGILYSGSALYQGTTSVVPQAAEKQTQGFSP